MSREKKTLLPGDLSGKSNKLSHKLNVLTRKLLILPGSLMMFVGVVGLSVLSSLLYSKSGLGAAEATPVITPAFDRLAEPTLPVVPSQADLGSVDYWLTCMVCHGDRGQGLTEEWRAVAGQEEMNCWQSRCHASNHPPEGFVLPRYAPRIMGEGSLARFDTAAELQEFISEMMPWQMPGMLEEDAYWRLTAFLLRENGVALGTSQLGPHNAAQVYLRKESSVGPLGDGADITKPVEVVSPVEAHITQEEADPKLWPGLVGISLAGMILVGLVGRSLYSARHSEGKAEGYQGRE
jgi:hypothetical protein